jgi:hypothetical protein
MATLTATTTDGNVIQFNDELVAYGGEKAVFFSLDRKQVVLFFYGHMPDRAERRSRLEKIVYDYNPTRDGDQAEYWRSHFCWPTGVIDGNQPFPVSFIQQHNLVQPVLGIATPVYSDDYFFIDTKTGSKREKEGKWFTAPKARRMLPEAERGNFLRMLQVCTCVARAVGRMHMAGLAHSDLSNKNVLIDPRRGKACIIDVDSLVVPGLNPPSVLGTPGYIAPEVLGNDAKPSMRTDEHALAILIYETLLLRHPLRGPKSWSTRSPEEDELLSMGKNAIFVEHPTDKRNNLNPPPAISYKRLGSQLAGLFTRAFVDGLHNPGRRPSALEWGRGLSRTLDLLHPSSPKMDQWFVLEKGMDMVCPYTYHKVPPPVPVINFHKLIGGIYKPEGIQLIVWDQLRLFDHHRFSSVNAADPKSDKTPRGIFRFSDGKWWFQNDSGETMKEWYSSAGRFEDRPPDGKPFRVRDGMQLVLSDKPEGRLAIIQFYNGPSG